MENNLLEALKTRYPEYIIEDFSKTPMGIIITLVQL